ncbi:hypothetical protein B0T22DRAFT_37021 [Podospora appendiculata]|uniref:Transmembrane protein n=1 Tax=Podospora appendiculata TaxID=314037 RepID=A0AAE0XH23_9PEZI|nr:hypothetical protein B0T22DRAFT_37021 [Podospora appendiculata]
MVFCYTYHLHRCCPFGACVVSWRKPGARFLFPTSFTLRCCSFLLPFRTRSFSFLFLCLVLFTLIPGPFSLCTPLDFEFPFFLLRLVCSTFLSSLCVSSRSFPVLWADRQADRKKALALTVNELQNRTQKSGRKLPESRRPVRGARITMPGRTTRWSKWREAQRQVCRQGTPQDRVSSGRTLRRTRSSTRRYEAQNKSRNVNLIKKN